MTFSLCKAIYENGEVKFESSKTRGLTLSQTIEDDKNYGTMVPANGKYFTYAVMNDDIEFTEKQAIKAVQFGQRRWRIYANVPKFRKVSKDYQGVIDFRIEFRTVDTDPDKQLNPNTIMYHYYPIQKKDHPLRGLCVVNKAFYFTSHGNGVYGSEFQKHGIPVQFPQKKYSTLDFDQVYAHELGHGLGLPHDTEEDQVMSFRYDIMAEYPTMRDQARIKAKYGHRFLPAWILMRWIKWLKVASER